MKRSSPPSVISTLKFEIYFLNLKLLVVFMQLMSVGALSPLFTSHLKCRICIKLKIFAPLKNMLTNIFGWLY